MLSVLGCDQGDAEGGPLTNLCRLSAAPRGIGGR